MKLNFQIANCLHPNSPVNTVVFAAFEAPDSKCNLHVASDRYKSQVEALKTLTWRYSYIYNNLKKIKSIMRLSKFRNSVGQSSLSKYSFQETMNSCAICMAYLELVVY